MAFIEIFDVEFNDIADSAVEHEEAGGLLDEIGGLVGVDDVEDGCEEFIHTLHVLDAGVQASVNVQNSGHVVVTVCASLLLLAL